jgi:hypothetical protein
MNRPALHSTIVTAALAAVTAVVWFSQASPADAAVSRSGRCNAAHTTTLLQTAQARVFRDRKHLTWACVLGSKVKYQITLGGCVAPPCGSLRLLTLTRRYLAYTSQISDTEVITREIIVLDLRTGTERASLAHAPATSPTRSDLVTDLVVSSAGQVAWIYRNVTPTGTVYEVHVGGSMVDQGPTIQPGSLAIAATTAYWQRDAAAQAATGSTLRPVGT